MKNGNGILNSLAIIGPQTKPELVNSVGCSSTTVGDYLTKLRAGPARCIRISEWRRNAATRQLMAVYALGSALDEPRNSRRDGQSTQIPHREHIYNRLQRHGVTQAGPWDQLLYAE